jgi:hypothetical protein
MIINDSGSININWGGVVIPVVEFKDQHNWCVSYYIYMRCFCTNFERKIKLWNTVLNYLVMLKLPATIMKAIHLFELLFSFKFNKIYAFNVYVFFCRYKFCGYDCYNVTNDITPYGHIF